MGGMAPSSPPSLALPLVKCMKLQEGTISAVDYSGVNTKPFAFTLSTGMICTAYHRKLPGALSALEPCEQERL